MRGDTMLNHFGPVGTNSPEKFDQQDSEDLDAVKEGRRERALELAIDAGRGNHADRDEIIKNARAFETYLKGE